MQNNIRENRIITEEETGKENNNIIRKTHIRAITATLLLFCVLICIGILRVEKIVSDQRKVDFKQDSLFYSMYYYIADNYERDAYLVSLSTFNAVEAQTDSTPNITASGLLIDLNKPEKHRYIGLSNDLLEEFPFGETVILENAGRFNGKWVVADAMNNRFIRHIDVLISNKGKHTSLKNVIIRRIK